MLVLAAVSDVQYQRLRGAVTPRFTLARAQTWDDALETIKGRPVEIAVVDALRTPGEVQTIQQVAARARVDRGTCARWFARAGLPSPREILAAARVLYAHRLLQDPGFTIDDVAKRLGYAQAKTFQQHARKYLGLTAGEMKLSLTADQATGRIVQGFLTPATHAVAASAA